MGGKIKKLPLLSDHMIVSVENTKVSTTTKMELIKQL